MDWWFSYLELEFRSEIFTSQSLGNLEHFNAKKWLGDISYLWKTIKTTAFSLHNMSHFESKNLAMLRAEEFIDQG